MSKFKVGDDVLFLKKDESYNESLKVGNTYRVARVWMPHYGLINDVKTITFVDEDQIDFYNGYKLSNRHKLHQAIKATGFHAEKLSLASNHAKTYFTGFTAESRFNSRGDITEERLNALLTTLAFAEHELLGVGAKTVDENNVSVVEEKTTMIIGETKIEGTLSEFNIFFNDKSKNNFDSKELYEKYFDSANNRIQQKKDAKVRNFLIVFLVFVVILSIYFLTR